MWSAMVSIWGYELNNIPRRYQFKHLHLYICRVCIMHKNRAALISSRSCSNTAVRAYHPPYIIRRLFFILLSSVYYETPLLYLQYLLVKLMSSHVKTGLCCDIVDQISSFRRSFNMGKRAITIVNVMLLMESIIFIIAKLAVYQPNL